jgi:hypothetical protein
VQHDERRPPLERKQRVKIAGPPRSQVPAERPLLGHCLSTKPPKRLSGGRSPKGVYPLLVAGTAGADRRTIDRQTGSSAPVPSSRGFPTPSGGCHGWGTFDLPICDFFKKALRRPQFLRGQRHITAGYKPDLDLWRDRAEEARTQAEQMSNPKTRRMMLQIAEAYEQMIAFKKGIGAARKTTRRRLSR